MAYKIIAPNKDYCGEIAGVPFFKGEAKTDNQLAIDYCKNKGYEVEEIQEENPGVSEGIGEEGEPEESKDKKGSK